MVRRNSDFTGVSSAIPKSVKATAPLITLFTVVPVSHCKTPGAYTLDCDPTCISSPTETDVLESDGTSLPAASVSFAVG